MLMLFLLLSAYCLFLIVMYIGWKRVLKRRTSNENKLDHFISVIIPVRNEAANITRLLKSLQNQEYKNFEVLLIDDHSEDNTAELAKKTSLPNLSIIKNPDIGKKKAITTGVKAARGTIITTTDGDCVVPATWLKTINSTFQNEKIAFAFGGVSLHQNGSLFSMMQAIEFSGVVGSSAATAELEKPTMCNGANLSYRKNIFFEVNGYESNEHVATGDDEFLMRKFQAKYSDGIRFIPNQSAIVQTEPQPDIRSFLQQRFRWASKWRFNNSVFARLLAVFIFLTQLGVITSSIVLSNVFSQELALLLIFKILLEAIFLFEVSKFLNHRWNWFAFLLLQVIYPLYVIITALASAFVKISWKGRKIQ